MKKNTNKLLAIALAGLMAGLAVNNAYAGDEVAQPSPSDTHVAGDKNTCKVKKDSCKAKSDSSSEHKKKADKNSCKAKSGCKNNEKAKQ